MNRKEWERPGKTTYVPQTLLRAITEQVRALGLRQGEIMDALTPYVAVAAQRALAAKNAPPAPPPPLPAMLTEEEVAAEVSAVGNPS